MTKDKFREIYKAHDKHGLMLCDDEVLLLLKEYADLMVLLDQARTLLALSCPDGKITERIDAKLKEWNS